MIAQPYWLPCPFCDRETPVSCESVLLFAKNPLGYRILCDKQKGGCGAVGPIKSTESEATDAWNLRLYTPREGDDYD